MRKIFIATAVAFGLTLTGCSTSPEGLEPNEFKSQADAEAKLYSAAIDAGLPVTNAKQTWTAANDVCKKAQAILAEGREDDAALQEIHNVDNKLYQSFTPGQQTDFFVIVSETGLCGYSEGEGK